MKVAQNKEWADPEPLLWELQGSPAYSHDTRKTVAKIRHASQYHDALLGGAVP